MCSSLFYTEFREVIATRVPFASSTSKTIEIRYQKQAHIPSHFSFLSRQYVEFGTSSGVIESL
jgi:hypothetical protein